MKAYLAAGHRVRTAVARFRPDLVHCMYGGVMAEMVTRAVKGTPVVVSFCGDDLLGELLSGPIRKLISRYGVLASHKAARRAHGIVVKSRNLQDALPVDIPMWKVRIIPNGVDFDRFMILDQQESRDRLRWPNDCFHVLFPANSGDPRKRPGLARAAVEAVEKSGCRIEMHHLRGVPHDQVPRWLNASDVVLLTSLHEGSPNIVKEALACNVPVVSVDVGDVRDRIDGISGCYLASADPADLARKLQLVYRGPRRIDSRSIVQDLSLRRVAQRLQQFYAETLRLAETVPDAAIHRPSAPVC